MAIKIIGSTIIDDSRNIVNAGIATVTSVSIGNTQVVSSARQLQNIASLDDTTTATIESAIANAPNNFNDLNVTGISTLGVTSATNLTAQQLNVSGVSTLSILNVGTGGTIIATTSSGLVGIGTTDPSQTGNASKVHISGGDLKLDGDNLLVWDGIFPSYITGSSGNSGYIKFNAGNDKILQYTANITSANISDLSPILTQTIDLGRPSLQYRNTWIGGNLFVGTATSTGTASQPLQVTGGAYVSGNVGIATTNPLSALDVGGDARVSGVVTATTFVGALTGTATTATKLETARTFEITGDVVASAISFDGTGNVSLAATIQPNSVALGSDTTGDYVTNITGTSNEITVTSGTGEGSTPTISVPNQFIAPQDVTVTRDLQVNRNLNVDGNITIGGTSSFIAANELRVKDKDIILGISTNVGGADVSTDSTANHGGIAIASTEGTPLIDINGGVGTDSIPYTYKQIMWLKSDSWTGLGTDAWIFNYGVGIGSTQVPNGVRLAAGGMQVTDKTISTPNLYVSGVGTFQSSGLKIRNPANTFEYTFTGGALLENATINLPSNLSNDTIAFLGVGNVFTGDATFSGGVIFSPTAKSITATTQTSGLLTLGGPSQTGAITLGQSTVSQTVNIAAGPCGPGTSKTINFGTRGFTGSFTQINIGPSAGIGTVLINSGTNLGIGSATPTSALDVIGRAYISSNLGIGTTNPTTNLDIDGGVRIRGILYDKDNQAGNLNQVLSSTGSGIDWVNAAPANAITGITILDEGSLVGGANSVSQLNFVGSIVSVASTAGIATITFSNFVSNAGVSTSVIGGIASVTQLSVSGVSTIGNLLITPVGLGATVGLAGIVTYYGDGSNLTNIQATSTYTANAGISTNLKGGLAGNIPYQSAPDATVFLANGSSGQILQSNGVGNAPTWVNAAPAGAITGLTVRDEGNIVGGANSISQFNFVGNIVSVGASVGIATITFLDYVSNSGTSTSAGVSTSVIGGIGSITQLRVTGISTFVNGPVLIGAATSTGTASQPLQVTGSAYVSSNLGIGTTNPQGSLQVGTAITMYGSTGIISATRYYGDGTNLTGILNNTISPSSASTSQFIGFSSVSSGVNTSIGVSSTFVFIPSSGNLGIGTTNPTSKLWVNGDGYFVGVLTANRIYSTVYGEFTGGSISGTNIVGTALSITGISTFTNGPVLIGTGTSTGTASQRLQVTGGAYFSGTANFGIGVTNPQYIFTVSDTGTPATVGLTNCLADFTTTANSYGQINLRNTSTGTNASSDIIVTADNGTDSSNFIDLGINNSGFSVGSWTINGPTDGYLYASDTNLSIGAASATKYVSIFAGGTLAANEKLRANNTGVGIGTTNPTQTLHVQGNARITGGLYDFNNGAGSTGQVLQSIGTGISWTTFSGGATVNNSPSGTYYPTMSSATSGTFSTAFVSSTVLTFVTSTGTLSATAFSGSGANLTGLTAGNLSGTIPSGVLGNSTLYVGTTAILLNRASATQSLTGVNIDGSSASVANAVTFNNGGAGAASGTTFNGSAAQTISYNTIGASPLAGSSSLVTTGTVTSGTWSGSFGAVSGANLTSLNATNLGSGTVPVLRLGDSGTRDATTYLRGDNTWATVSGGITVSDDTSTNATRYPTFEDVTSGNSTSINVSSTKLTFNPSTGTLSATVFTSLSDANKKKNIRPIENAIDITKKLEGVRFDWKDTGSSSIGVIAQEVEKVLPELVVDTDGVKSVSYGNIVGVLIEAIKEQQVRIEELERKLNA